MKVAIAGAGNVGTSIAEDLISHGHEVVLIESNIELVAKLRPTVEGVQWIEGDACEVASLQRAGLGDADVMVAATGDDEDNLVVALLAKQEFAVPRVVARVNHPKNRWLFNETWGVDVSVSTPHLLTALVEEAVSVGTLVRLLQFANGEVRLVEVTLAEDSPAGGKSIAELTIPRDASIVAVVRESRVVVPKGDTVLYPGDEVILLAGEEAEDALRGMLVGTHDSNSYLEPITDPRVGDEVPGF
jgi:trk system potassium uptake protein TrkA